MKKSELKTITKCILKEIYQDPSTYSFQSAINLIKQKSQKEYPTASIPSEGHKSAHELIDASVTLIKFLFFSILRHDKESIKDTGQKILYTYQVLKVMLGNWMETIINNDVNGEKKQKLKLVTDEFSNHFNQLINQINTIQLSLVSGNEGSLIGASKQIEHLHEIIQSLKDSVDDFFELTLNNK